MIDAAVVDASIALKWVISQTDSAAAARLEGAALFAPDLLLIECANALWKYARLGMISKRHALSKLAAIHSAPIALTPTPLLLTRALEIAIELSHPVYDCVYLALAEARGLPLVTADGRLAAAVSKSKTHKTQVLLLSQL